MTLSRSAARLSILIAIGAPAAAAQPGAPEDPVGRQREELREAIFPPCPRPVGSEIVVCGRREEEEARAHRLPALPGTPGAADRAGGEQRDALAIDSSRCTTVGRHQQCSGGLDLLGIGVTVVRALVAIRARSRDD